MGELEDALRLDQQALDILSRRLGPGHADVALAQGNMGAVLAALGRTDDARRAIQQALATDEARLGADHPSVAGNLLLLANIDRRAGNVGGGARSLERACRILDDKVAPGHRDRARCLMEWSLLRIAQGRRDEAGERFQAAQEVYGLELGRDHPEALLDAARYWAALGDSAKAVQAVQRALDAGLPVAAVLRNPDLVNLRGTTDFETLLAAANR